MIRIALIGFGEVGQTLAEDFLALGEASLSAFDIKFSDPESGPMRATRRLDMVEACRSATEAVRDADLVLSAVTAERTFDAAQSVVGHLKPDTWYVDLNSASPQTKIDAAASINAAGGRYVETSIMSPIGPKRLQSPMLAGGTHAKDFAALAQKVGMTGLSVFSDIYGQASAAKMCRSVIVKGFEALITESLVSAKHYGVEDTVVASLSDLFPGLNWGDLSAYMISRALKHGRRRAEEMREVAKTVADADMVPLLSEAIAKRQDWSADLGINGESSSLAELLTTISQKKEGLS